MLVFDTNRFGTKREIDDNGYLRVSACNITKSQIRPYYGREIPGWRELDLDADTIYNVYCPAEELQKALESFNNLPLTREHIEVDVENVPKDKIVGSLGDHAEYKKPYVKNSLIVYDKKDIDWILSGKKKELSCGYRYTPVRQSGEFDGKHYDFIMTDIIGNHVALVKEGRAGHDVMVADESPNFTESQNDNTINTKENEMLANDEFKEADHPRDKDGKFTSAGSGSSAGSIVEGSVARVGGTTWVKVKKIDGNKAIVSPLHKEDIEKGRFGEEELVNLSELRTEEDIHTSEKEKKESSVSGSIEHKGAKIDIKKDGKYADIKIYAPEGKKFKNGDTFYTTEAEADKAEELAKKIIDNEFGGEGSEKKEESKENKSFVENKFGVGKETKWKKSNAFRIGDVVRFRDGSIGKVEDISYPAGSNKMEIQAKVYDKDSENEDDYSYVSEKFDEFEKIDNSGEAKDAMSKEDKIGIVMKEFKDGELKSSSGEKVTDPKQAKAIALSEADRMAKDADIPEKAGKPEKAGEEEALNKGETKMAEEVKEAIAEKADETKEEKVVEDACGKAKDAKCAKDEGVDKRKLIDEIGGILKGKLDEELWRTVIEKAEKLAYSDSERSADDKKPAKDEDKDDLKGKEAKEFAEGVEYGEKKEKAEPKKLDSEHESEGMKKAEKEMAKDSALAMDIDAIKAQVREEVMADFKAREEARKAVRGFVGDVNVMAFDSAEDIYKFACGKSGMDLDEIVSYKDAFKGLSAGKSKALALDASPVSGSNEECLKDIRIA